MSIMNEMKLTRREVLLLLLLSHSMPLKTISSTVNLYSFEVLVLENLQTANFASSDSGWFEAEYEIQVFL